MEFDIIEKPEIIELYRWHSGNRYAVCVDPSAWHGDRQGTLKMAEKIVNDWISADRFEPGQVVREMRL